MGNPFDVFTILAEVTVGLMGFEVIALAVGRRSTGIWSESDDIRFKLMFYSGLIALILCILPMISISESEISSDILYHEIKIYFMIFLVLWVIYYLITLPNILSKKENIRLYIYIPTIYLILSFSFFLLSFLDYLNSNIHTYYFSIIQFHIFSIYVFTRMMAHK